MPAAWRDCEACATRESRLVLVVGVVDRAIFDGEEKMMGSLNRDRSAGRSCGLRRDARLQIGIRLEMSCPHRGVVVREVNAGTERTGPEPVELIYPRGRSA